MELFILWYVEDEIRKVIISCVDIIHSFLLLFDSSTYFSLCMMECKNSLTEDLYYDVIRSLWRSGVLLNFCLATPRRALRFARPYTYFSCCKSVPVCERDISEISCYRVC